LAFYRLTDERPRIADLLINLALIEKSRSRAALALEYLDEANRFLTVRGYAKTRLRLITNRGVVLLKLGDIEKAMTSLMEGKALAVEEREHIFGCALSTNIGHIFRMQGNYETAIEFYGASVEHARHEDSARQEAVALEFLGETHLDAGHIDKAVACLAEAQEIAQRIAPQGDLMMEVLRRLGELHARTGQIPLAREELRKAVNLCASRGEKREQTLAERALLMLDRDSTPDWTERVRAILTTLLQMDDRFEHMRTVFEIAQTQDPKACASAWFEEALVAANYYLDSHGIVFWKKRLQSTAGHARRLASRGGGNVVGAPVLFSSSKSPAFLRCLDSAQLAARTRHPVLILGETGAGKEVLTRAIHTWSDRNERPLVAINCGALPRDLVESELFGHAKGTFTGASADKVGLLEAANHGTVLLDEIGDLPLETQTKLLRFLDSGEFRRVGDTRPRTSTARVIAATNKDLRELVRAGRFREDLFHRLSVFHVDVPPLRERREDIIDLALAFLVEEAAGGTPPALSPDVEQWMLEHTWPGNVRELRNVCRYLAARAWGRPFIRIDDLPSHMSHPDGSVVERENAPPQLQFQRQRDALERQQIVDALRQTRGTILEAAKLLGVGRNTLAHRIKAHGIDLRALKS
jgi:transcriptional regulator with PAS, ATPase and Fis domain/Flp pilus assembly protein TadD